jgi:hypothetical protein
MSNGKCPFWVQSARSVVLSKELFCQETYCAGKTSLFFAGTGKTYLDRKELTMSNDLPTYLPSKA